MFWAVASMYNHGMEQLIVCENTICQNKFHISAGRCPHCGHAYFPNVKAAKQEGETLSLNQRHQAAINDIKSPGMLTKVSTFESRCKKTLAVIARPMPLTLDLAWADTHMYSTFYQNVEAERQMPQGSKWDVLRRLADGAMFTYYEKYIRFAALSLDGMGLHNYGECSIILKEEFTEERTSVFEENTVMFMKHHDIKIWDAPDLPPGYRAPWEQRHILCTAKLACRINEKTQESHFPQLLLSPGETTETDEFVEVHIFGPITIRAVAKVIVKRYKRRPLKRDLKILEDKLKAYNIPLEVR